MSTETQWVVQEVTVYLLNLKRLGSAIKKKAVFIFLSKNNDFTSKQNAFGVYFSISKEHDNLQS